MAVVDDVKRFWSKTSVNPITGCIEWTASTGRGGYGQFGARQDDGTLKIVKAHRHAYALVHGPLSDDAHVLHECDNPLCVNAYDHLFLGTNQDNIRDCAKKGRIHNQVLLPSDHIEIGRLYATGDYTQRQLAEQFGVRPPRISMVINHSPYL